MIGAHTHCQATINDGPLLRRCGKPSVTHGSFCCKHGCHICGHVILADSEDRPHPVCAEHYELIIASDLIERGEK